jgi:hypothetical protein
VIKNPKNEGAMKKAAASSLLIAVALVAFPVIAEAQQPKKLPRLRYLVTGCGRGLNGQAFSKVCARWATLKDRTSSLRGAGRVET